MSVLLPTRAGDLSRAQEDQLSAYRDYWKSVRNSTGPVDRVAAERAVEVAYNAARLSAPEEIVWCQSPVGMEQSRKERWLTSEPGRAVKSTVVDEVLRQVSAAIDDRVPVRARMAVTSGMEFEPQYFVSSVTLSNALAEGASGVKWGARARAKMLASIFKQRRVPPYSGFNQSRWLQHEGAGLLGKAAYFYNVCGYTKETEPLHGLWQLAINCGAMIPHERICWLSERHDTLSFDISGQLHNGQGPAVRYPDGWSLHAWKGVVVPSWIIEHPDRVERIHIDRERNPIIRRCMIDIMTPQRYVATGAATRFAVDQSGVLWRKQWRDWSDAWAAVEVINGTPEPDGSRTHYFLQVPPEMRTPTEAVAWTYGMTANRYAGLTIRT